MADSVSPPGSWAEHHEDAKVEEHQIAKDARNKGADVFEFDPNATPQQKAEQVKKVRPQIPRTPMNHAVDHEASGQWHSS